LSLQNALVTLLYVALHCPYARPTSFHLSLSTPSNDLGDNISDIVDSREHLAFWHDINNLEFMGILGER
jgi:hypothetical protein